MRADQATHYHRVLVTGAAGGIGQAIVRRLAENGEIVGSSAKVPGRGDTKNTVPTNRQESVKRFRGMHSPSLQWLSG